MIILFGFSFTIITFLVLFWFFSKADNSLKKQEAIVSVAVNSEKKFTISSKDIETIAGDDIMVTQLDLARAYLETDRKNLAKSILNNVIMHGAALQKQEAKILLES